MKSIIQTPTYKIIVDGSSIRVNNDSMVKHSEKDVISNRLQYKIGIVSVLPRVQIALGGRLNSFVEALEFSRLPLALNKTLCKGEYETYDIIRLETGNVREATIATLSVYAGIMVGITYNKSLLLDKEFRKLVKLSAMQQLYICSKGDSSRLFKATSCISTLTGEPRDKLVVVETARSIKVKVRFKSELNLPLFYTFVLDKSDKYSLTQIAFDYNAVALRLNAKAEKVGATK